MNPEQFVNMIRQAVIDDNVATYKDLFENTSIQDATDQYWIRALGLFHELSDEDKETFLKIIRQVSLDTISSVFAIFDGVSCQDDIHGNFSLRFDSESDNLNGDLQDILLELEEDA